MHRRVGVSSMVAMAVVAIIVVINIVNIKEKCSIDKLENQYYSDEMHALPSYYMADFYFCFCHVFPLVCLFFSRVHIYSFHFGFILSNAVMHLPSSFFYELWLYAADWIVPDEINVIITMLLHVKQSQRIERISMKSHVPIHILFFLLRLEQKKNHRIIKFVALFMYTSNADNM